MLEVRNLTKVYVPKKGKPVTALKNVNLKFEETGMVFVLGKSGSGKSTLLNLLGGLDNISGGEVIIKGKSSKDFSQSDFDSYRNTYLGFIFQEYNILNEFTVGQNIALALELQNKHADQKTVDALMKEVDLEGFSNRKPHELSGGQKQRVAIARALVKDPEIIMADEPTGALDSNTGRQIFETLQKLSKTKLVIIVSHDREYAEFYGDRVIEFKDGKVISDIKKYKSPSESFADGNITVTNDNIIHVKKRGKFEEQDKKELIRKVLNYLDNDSEDLIISTDARANREFKKNVRLDADGNREAFKETQNTDLQIKQYRANDFKLKKSNLPSRHAFRIGASSLKTKPFRLVLTILLCSIAFTLFGLVDTVAAYSKVATMHSSLNTAGITSSAIIKEREHKESDYSYFNSEDMNSLDIGVLENKLNVDLLALERLNGWYSLDHHFGATGGDVTGNFDSYYVRAFNGYIESTANDISDFGFTITAGTYPTAANQIAISEHTAESFIDGGYHGDVNTTDISINSSSELIGKTLVFDNKTYTIKAIIDTNFNSKYQKIKGVQSYQDMLISSMMNEVNMLNQYGYHNAMFIANGFSYNFPQDENGNIISAQFKIPASDGQLKNIIEFSYELNNSVRYSLKNEISIVLDNFDYIMKTISQAFLYVGIAMAVFAALMLLNYISISISNKKKEIGILRAIGARSSDVFKIFFYESLIITIINTILAIILTLVLCMVLNSQTFSSGIPLSILNFGIRQLLLIIAVGSFTAVISTFFPVYRIARKKPVDAIKR